MVRQRRQHNSPTGPIAEFFAGVGIGVGVVAGELVIFAFSTLMDALSKVAHTLPSSAQTPPIETYFSLITLILFLGGFLQHFFLGLLNSDAFSLGFIIGDLVMLFLLGSLLWTISPSIVTGMILAFLTVFVGFCTRIFRSRPPSNDFYY
jgi:hypothetical protein